MRLGPTVLLCGLAFVTLKLAEAGDVVGEQLYFPEHARSGK